MAHSLRGAAAEMPAGTAGAGDGAGRSAAGSGPREPGRDFGRGRESLGTPV